MSTNVEIDLFNNFVRQEDNNLEEERKQQPPLVDDSSLMNVNNSNGIKSSMHTNEMNNSEEENYISKLKELVKEYSQLDQQEPSSDDELIKFTKDKEERLLFRLGRLLEKRKKQRKRKYEE